MLGTVKVVRAPWHGYLQPRVRQRRVHTMIPAPHDPSRRLHVPDERVAVDEVGNVVA